MDVRMTPTARDELDRVVSELAEARSRWARLGVGERLSLLAACTTTTSAVAPEMVAAGCLAKGLAPDGPDSMEEWLGGPVAILRNLQLLAATFCDIARHGHPKLPAAAVRQRHGSGQLVVDGFPRRLADRLLFPGFREEIWMQPDVTADSLGDTMAVAYAPGAGRDGKVALVLGAGNVAGIGPMDALYKLFVENQVVVLKMNPVNEYLGPFIERGLAPLIDGGCHLVHHTGVDEIHLTGSRAVHDAIVWGATPDEQARNRAAGAPTVSKRVTSELGCVTPVIAVPGSWTDRQLAFQARNVATMVAVNGSCNCNAAKILVTWKHWPQRKAFLKAVEDVLAALPPRKAYYPGSPVKYAAFVESHPQARRLCAAPPGTLPWTTIFDVDPEADDEIVFNREAWCPILAETALSGSDDGEFLDRAVDFVNQCVEGTLSMALLANPATQAWLGNRFEQAIADLRYGTIGINHWPALSFVLAAAPWGAYPGHTLEGVGSGIGVVHNTLMFTRPQKSVIRGPFTMRPTPPWFVGNPTAHVTARRLAAFEAKPALWKIAGIAASAAAGR
jgi:hypothetical protein